MPLIFVHGVANRRGESAADQDAFNQRIKVRDGLFRSIAFADRVKSPVNLHIENPYWGDLASRFAWNLGSVPKGGDEALGSNPLSNSATLDSESGRLAQIAVATTTGKTAATPQQPNTILLTLARQATLSHAVDAIIAAAAQTKPSAAAAVATDEELAVFAARAIAYAEANPHPDWLSRANIKNDNTFLDGLNSEVASWQPPAHAAGSAPVAPSIEALGISEIINRLKDASLRLGNSAKNIFTGMAADAADTLGGLVGDATEPLLLKARPAISTLVGRFFGDVFVYINTRGTKDKPGPIVKTVIEAIDAAVKEKKPGDDKLYIVAHSMGGQIVYDILTFYRPDIQCDLLITVGSQVGFFEELKLLQISDASINAASVPSTVACPKNVAHWINAFDLTDIFGFTEEGIFDGVSNFEFDTQTLPVLSHGVYFARPRLYERLRARIAKAFPPPIPGGQD